MEKRKHITKGDWTKKDSFTVYTSGFYSRFRLALIIAIVISFTYSMFNDSTIIFTMSLPLLPIILLILIANAHISDERRDFSPRFLIASIVGYLWWIVLYFIANIDWHISNMQRGGTLLVLGIFAHMYLIIVIPAFIIRMTRVGIKPTCIEDSNYVSYIWVSLVYSLTTVVRDSMGFDRFFHLPLSIMVLLVALSNLLLIGVGIKIRRYILVKHYAQQ